MRCDHNTHLKPASASGQVIGKKWRVSMNLTWERWSPYFSFLALFIVVGFFDTVILYLKQCIYFGVFTVKNLCFNPFDQKFYLKSKNNLMGRVLN